MLILLILSFVAIGIIGAVISSKSRRSTLEGIGDGMAVSGFAIAIFVLVIGTIIIGINAHTFLCEDKIKLYQSENTKIEQQINDIVENYKDYEKTTLKELKGKDVTTLVTLYPELKTDTLVRKQIEIYQKNKQKIVKLKEERIVASVVRWWLYFGG